MIRKSIFTFLASCLIFAASFAQGLQNNIPKDANFVLTINPGVLNSKIKFSKLKEFEFFQMGMDELTRQAGPMASEIKKFIDDPASFGLDMMSSSYAFGKIDGNNFHMGYILNIADKGKFDELIQTYVAPMAPVKNMNNMDYVSQEGVSLAWNSNQILVSSVELDYKGEEDWEIFNERKLKEADNWMNTIMAGSGLNSIATHPKFKMTNATQNDVSFFMDYEKFNELTAGLQGQNPGAQMANEMMSGMYEDSYISMGLNFDKGATKLSSRYFMNEEMTNAYRQISDATFNKKFLKYIPKNNLGFLSFNFNLSKLIEVVKSSDNEMLSQYPIYEGMAVEALKGMGLEMSADEIYKLWNGDITFVVTGMKEFEKEVTTYEFDDDFNKKEVKEMKKETLPEFIMLMSHKNKDGLLKLIDFGKQSSMINEQKGIFQVNVPDMPMDVFMKVHNDMVVVSNNKNVVSKKARKVFKRKNLIKAKDAAQLMSSSSLIVWNIPETMNAVAEMDDVKLDGPEGMLFNMGKDSFDSLIIQTDKKVSDSMSTIMSLNFNNKNMNSLEQIFGLINDAFKSMGGGSSM